MTVAAVRAAFAEAARVTIPTCLAFYLCAYGLGSTEMAVYASFGALALGAFSAVGGTGRQRTLTYLGSLAAGLVLVTLGTLLAVNAFAAAGGMLAIGFAVAFAGVGGPRLSGPAVGLQLFYILPCFPPYSPGSLDERLIGLAVGILALTLADRLLWPAPDQPGYAARLGAAVAAIRRLLQALRPALADPSTRFAPQLATAEAEAGRATDELRFSHVPLAERPAGPGLRDRGLTATAAMVRTTSGRLGTVSDQLGTEIPDQPLPDTAALVGSLDAALRQVGDALTTGGPTPEVAALDGELERYGDRRTQRMPTYTASGASMVRLRLAVSVDEAGDAVRNAMLAVRAMRGAPLPAEPDGLGPASGLLWFAGATRWERWWHRIRGNLTLRSVYLQNAVRLAVGLAVARLLAEAFELQHGFWVLLATLTLMRTSAASTRAALLPAFAGVMIGAVLGGLLLVALGPVSPVYAWALPVFTLLALAARPLLGVVAAQAGVTVLIVVLFALIAPADWQLAEVRLVDVVVGGLIGAVIGLVVWPRGGAGEMRRVTAECLRSAAAALAAGTRSLAGTRTGASPGAAIENSTNQVRRSIQLADTTYAQYRSERPSGEPAVDWVMILASTRRIVRGSAALRHRYPGAGPLPWPGLATELVAFGDELSGYYREFADELVRRRPPRGAPAAEDHGTVPAVLLGSGVRPAPEQEPWAALRALDTWAWLRGLAEDLEAIRSSTWTASERPRPGRQTTSR